MSSRAPVASGAAPAAGSFQLLPASEGQLAVQGPLTFATARQAREIGRRAIAASSAAALEIDCRRVSAADSAGLAVLIDWLAAARLAGHSLRFRALPAGLNALGHISEVTELLERGV